MQVGGPGSRIKAHAVLERVKIQVGKVRRRRKDDAYPHSYRMVPEVIESLLLSG